jgi:hypothetical protein
VELRRGRLGVASTDRDERKYPRCGAAALDFGDVRIADHLVEIPLCRTHFRVLQDSTDQAEWANA